MKNEKTLILIKHDGIQRNLIGEIIGRYERVGLKLIAVKMLVPTSELIENHYTVDPDWRRKTGEKTIKNYKEKGKVPPSEDPYEITGLVLERLKKYFITGPVIAMIWQGAHAVQIARKITGGTEPFSAADIGTIRGDFALDSYLMSDKDERAVRNLVHASTSPEEAEKEIALWFKPEEVIKYRLVQDEILYKPELGEFLE